MRDTVLLGDVLEELKKVPDGSVQCCVTSPPYWGLRDYGHRRWYGGEPCCDHAEVKEHGPHHPGQVEQTKWKKAEAAGKGQTATTQECLRCGAWYGQIGLEPTPQAYVENLVEVFREVRRVLRDDGTLWLNLGDSYANDTKWGGSTSGKHAAGLHGAPVDRGKRSTGLKAKDLIGIPWRVAFALQDDGWFLRSDIIWAKGNAMPESVRDRPTRSHEYIFLLTKNSSYFYDREAILEPFANIELPGATFEPSEDPEAQRNKRSVWHINPKPYPGAHFAVFPEELPEVCIRAGTSEKGCCSTCGAPLKRVVERPKPPREGEVQRDEGLERTGMSHFKYNEWLKKNPPVTVGWEATCECHKGRPARCLVLDPFSGSGTTLAVAAGLRRDYLGIELNPEYHELIKARLATNSLGVYSPSEFRGKQEEYDNLPWE